MLNLQFVLHQIVLLAFFVISIAALMGFGFPETNPMLSMAFLAGIFILSEAGITVSTYRESRRWKSLADMAAAIAGNDNKAETHHTTVAQSIMSLKNLLDAEITARKQEQKQRIDSSEHSKNNHLMEDMEREKEFFLKVLNSASLYAFIVISMEGSIKSWNTGAENIFGWDREAALNRSVSFTFIKDDTGVAAKIQRRRSKQVMNDGKAIFTMMRRRKNGEEFPLHCTVTALKDAQGKIDGFLEIGRDVTDEVKKDQAIQDQMQTARDLANSLEKIDDIVKTINDIARQTNLLAVNAAVEAAHAGEYGKGFSVVADEIRILSKNSTDSTHKISDLVNRIHLESQKVSKARIDRIEID